MDYTCCWIRRKLNVFTHNRKPPPTWCISTPHLPVFCPKVWPHNAAPFRERPSSRCFISRCST
ncbi:hypothetical protein Fmac_018445 [Flemingia macrophylla]|uniref:Uncharacterized protein n=1 Tax=Flemingia macrophylla TaxID=520843 RepID=A0ABD1M501_9FABA